MILKCREEMQRDLFCSRLLEKSLPKTLLDSDFTKAPYEEARGKHVLVIGGGDTGNDCVGTSVRLGAKSVTQLEMMPMPPTERAASNPWPEWPKVFKNRLWPGRSNCSVWT